MSETDDLSFCVCSIQSSSTANYPLPATAAPCLSQRQSLIPVVMAGIIAVYGLVVSVLIVGSLNPSDPYPLYAGFIHLAAGLSCGLTGLAAGRAIGVVGDACARAYLRQGRVFVAMVLMLVSLGDARRVRLLSADALSD